MLFAALFPPVSIFHTTLNNQTLVIHLCSEEGEGTAQPWDLSFPQTPSGAHHLPVLSSTIVFTFMVRDLKNTSADLVLFAGKLQNLPDVLPVELIAVIHCGYLPCSCCPSPRRLLAKADTRAVLVNKTRNFTAYSKSPDEKLAHSYLQHQSCLTPQ